MAVIIAPAPVIVPVAVGYAASKAMLDGFATALEPWLRPWGISVTRVYPGAMQTAHQRFKTS